ncbi:hypothetical protein Sjap_015128 [Stephania japonica]|uniref:Uncharacterized protein n=1 Tax=Stephania japonica TaxID=461633 RepID=A0AAP0III9_9MAGN
MDNSDKEGPRARLEHHAKAKTHGPRSGHPEPVELDPEPWLSTQRAWTWLDTTRRSPCPLEKHGPRSFKRGRPSRGTPRSPNSFRRFNKKLGNFMGTGRRQDAVRVLPSAMSPRRKIEWRAARARASFYATFSEDLSEQCIPSRLD